MARLRTFIAIDVSDTIRERLITLQETLSRNGAEVKWVEEDNLHVTLLFLGEVDDREVLSVCRTVLESCARRKPFSMSVETIGCFPNLRRPRVVWVGVGEGTEEVMGLHDDLEEGLLQLGCYRREARQYTPHITLGRVKREEDDGDLSALLLKKSQWQAGDFTVKEVLVMSSELRSEGPVYSVLSRAKLRPS